MPDDWTVRIEGDEEADRRVERLALFLSDLRSFWPLVTRLFVGWMREQFDTEGEFGGDAWAPLSPDYAARKSLSYPGKKILVASGAMRQAASRPTRTVTPTSLTLTIDSEIAPFHQEGTDRMPARPLIFGDPLPLAAQAELDLAAERYVADLAARL